MLKEALLKSQGADLRRLPEIPITLLPEMREMEIREGLIEIIMQVFKPGCNGIGLMQIVDEGLERLSDTIAVGKKSSLKDKVKKQVDVLARDFLKEYLIYDEIECVYRSTDNFKPHYKTMEHITLALRAWAGIGPQKTFDYPFGSKQGKAGLNE